MKISEIMTKKVLVIRQETKVERMLELFSKHELTGAPVIDAEGNMMGVVSLTDLRHRTKPDEKRQSSGFYVNQSWGVVDLEPEEKDELVEDIMTNLIICAEEDDHIERAADLMTCHAIHRVVVTKQGVVTGIITSGDLVKEFRRRLRLEM